MCGDYGEEQGLAKTGREEREVWSIKKSIDIEIDRSLDQSVNE